MKELLIIGARGFGREVFELAKTCYGYGTEWRIKGFLDDKQDALQGLKGNYAPILSPVEEYNIEENDVFVCALGSAEYKKHYAELVLGKGGKFINLVHPTASVQSDISSLMGVIIFPFTCITVDVELSDFVSIQHYTLIGHDARIGKWCHMSAYSFVGGYGIVEEGVTVYTGAKVMPHKTVGAGSVVGAGSIVIKNVKPRSTVFGIPARQI